MAGITPKQLRAVLISTENGNDRSRLDRFSYAGGASTYSFGLLQFDVGTNHGNVQSFLRDNGFSDEQIAQLSQQGGVDDQDLDLLNKQLQAIPRARLEAFTDDQLVDAVARIDELVEALGARNAKMAEAVAGSEVLQLALADYDNQFGIGGLRASLAPPNGMLSYLEGNTVALPGGTLQLADTLRRQDIQAFISATRYGVDHRRSVEDREVRLVAALADLGLDSDTRNASSLATGASKALGTGCGAHEAVRALQGQLAGLGFTGPDGRPLHIDGEYGPATLRAVKAFQHQQGLGVDGIAGQATFHALRLAVEQQAGDRQLSNLADPIHPGHDLYLQARDGVRRLDERHGRAFDCCSDNLAAALAVSAHGQGLRCIDQVVLSDDASHAWAVQGDLCSPFRRLASVGVMQGMGTSIRESTDAFERLAPAITPRQETLHDGTLGRSTAEMTSQHR